MSHEWYYAIEGKVTGPISAEHLKVLVDNGTLVRSDHLWKDGLADWIAAGTVKGLFAGPPPAPMVPTDFGDQASATLPPKQYKVLSQKDKWFSGKFDPDLLEQALNSYSQHGWMLKAAVTASIHGIGGAREEMVMILER